MEKSITIQSVDSIKNQLVNKILIIGTSIGFLAFISSLFPFEAELINADFFLDISALSALLVTYLLRKKLSLIFRSNMILILLFVLFISDVLENGLNTPDFVIVVLIPFLSILIYSLRVTVALYVICIISYLIIGFLFVNGLITSNYYDPTGDSYLRWIELILVLSVVTVMITLFLDKFNSTIYKLINNLESQKEDLTDRERLLSVITKNIPRTTLTVIDSNLIIQFTDGSQHLNRDLDPSQFVGTKVIDFLKAFEAEGISKMMAAYEQCFQGKSQEVQLSYEDDILLFKVLPLISINGQIKRVLVVTENITAQVENQKIINENIREKNVLLQEIHHRVKNNLAVVSGLLTLQSYNIDDIKSKYILEKSTNRIMSIAKVHEMLYESKNFNRIPFHRYINELASIILDSMNHDDKAIAFNTDITVDYISINHGVPLGIIFNELITNSVKYGFSDNFDNSINIRVYQDNDRFEVEYEDNGVGIDNFENAVSKSLGFTLIESLMEQIDADFSFDTKNKFKLSFSFPTDSVDSIIPSLN